MNNLALVPVAKKSKKKKSKKQSSMNLSANALVYNGPSRMPVPRGAPEPDAVVVEIIIINSVASSGAGVISTVFDSWSQVTTAADWSQYSALYSECRVLSMDIELNPWNRYNLPTTTVAAPLYVVDDRTDGTALASLTAVAGYTSVQAYPPSTRVRRVIRMSGSNEAAFTATSSSPGTADRLYIKLYSAGNTASTTYYDYIDRLMVQFRNRK